MIRSSDCTIFSSASLWVGGGDEAISRMVTDRNRFESKIRIETGDFDSPGHKFESMLQRRDELFGELRALLTTVLDDIVGQVHEGQPLLRFHCLEEDWRGLSKIEEC